MKKRLLLLIFCVGGILFAEEKQRVFVDEKNYNDPVTLEFSLKRDSTNFCLYHNVYNQKLDFDNAETERLI